MKPLLHTLAAMLASVLLYGAVFSVVHRPLTLGEIAPLIRVKAAHLQSREAPRVVIFGGSNGRFSHRCQPIAEATGRPCTNFSVAVGLGLDFQLQQLEPLLRAGDLVYLPLEYSQYRVNQDEMHGGAENAVLVHDFPEQLHALPLERQWRAWASFDLPFLVHGVLEMGLAHQGARRRAGVTLLTEEGDQRGHTAAAGQPYRAFLQSARFDGRRLPAASDAQSLLAGFLVRMRERGVRVVGGLPTTPKHVSLDPADIAHVRSLFLRQGQSFLELPGLSQYSLEDFFDTLYHLNEEAQIRHSKRVGHALAQLLQTDGRTP